MKTNDLGEDLVYSAFFGAVICGVIGLVLGAFNDGAKTGGLVGMIVGAILGVLFGVWLYVRGKQWDQQKHREEQQGYRKQMIDLGEQLIGLFETMPNLLSSVEKYLDRAETNFADGAFAPFWDSIENAAKTLGRFDEGIQRIKDNSSHYPDLIRSYEDTPPPFPLARQSVEKLGVVATATAERMQAIVRKAQRNFQFATIYEQRKTNQILVAGFTNLAQALNQMTGQITASISWNIPKRQ